MNKQTGYIAGGAAVVLLLGAGIGLAVGGGGSDKKAGDTDQTTTSLLSTLPADDGNNGNSSNGNGNGNTPPSQPTSSNAQPTFSNVDATAEFGDDDGNQVPFARVDGHAIDPDGHDDQEVDHVDISWGDGTTTVASRGGNNAFSDQHSYDTEFGGQTVTVKVTAVDDDGATVSRTISLDLPSQ